MTRRRRLILPCAMLAVLFVTSSISSCGRPFDPYWRVEKLRVLAIKADPVTLKPGKVSTVESLVITPTDKETKYTWDWCPFRTSAQNEYECPFTKQELVDQISAGFNMGGGDMMGMGMGPGMMGQGMMGGLPPGFDIGMLIPDFELGNEPTAKFAYPLTADVVKGLCEATQSFLADQDEETASQVSITNCDRGYEITIRMIVEHDGDKIIAAKRINLWTGRDEFDNSNPVVKDIQIRVGREGDVEKAAAELDWVKKDAARKDQWHTIPADAPLPVMGNIMFEIRSIVDPDSVESFTPVAPQGSGRDFDPPEKEAIVYRWFTGAGDINDSGKLFKDGVSKKTLEDASITELNISFIPNATEDEIVYEGQNNDWDRDGIENDKDQCPSVRTTSQTEEGKCVFSIWSVARDGRLGIDWVERKLEVIDHFDAPRAQ